MKHLCLALTLMLTACTTTRPFTFDYDTPVDAGLQRQVENETYCVEILTQVAAATKALESVALMLLDQHLQHCLTHAADPTERDQKLTEASQAIARLVHS